MVCRGSVWVVRRGSVGVVWRESVIVVWRGSVSKASNQMTNKYNKYYSTN